MRSNQLITGALAVVATSSLIGLGSAAVASEPTTQEPTTTHERGVVLECSGIWKGKHVYAELYENSTAGNFIQVVIDDGDVAGGSRQVRTPFKDGRDVRGAIRLHGKRAVVAGTARVVGKRTAVHEEHDDAGEHITVDGTHRRLVADLALTWKTTTAPLDCSDSFVYDLQVTRESTVE
jgi:hypothetical protein